VQHERIQDWLTLLTEPYHTINDDEATAPEDTANRKRKKREHHHQN
jgi:hypothetical protein